MTVDRSSRQRSAATRPRGFMSVDDVQCVHLAGYRAHGPFPRRTGASPVCPARPGGATTVARRSSRAAMVAAARASCADGTPSRAGLRRRRDVQPARRASLRTLACRNGVGPKGQPESSKHLILQAPERRDAGRSSPWTAPTCAPLASCETDVINGGETCVRVDGCTRSQRGRRDSVCVPRAEDSDALRGVLRLPQLRNW